MSATTSGRGTVDTERVHDEGVHTAGDRTVEGEPWRHLPALDGLRAGAVIAVLAFHAGYLQGGFLGVDLFFVLSGFLITSLLIRDANPTGRGGIDLAAFWGRRFRRLLPAAFVMIAVVGSWAALFGSGADLAGVRDDGPWAVAYLANWHFISTADGYWQSFAQPSMFDHLWSLAIEEQFYLLWPVVVVAIWAWSKRPQRTLLVVSVAGVAASLATMVWLYDGVEPTRVYMGTDTRAASLLVGAIAATDVVRRAVRRIIARLERRTAVVAWILSATLAGAIVWSWVSIDGASSALLYRGGMLAHSVACAALISLVVVLDRAPLVRLLACRPLVWIGTLSYGLYLWHWPIFVILSPERTGLDGWRLAVVRVGLSVALAAFSFRLVEDPIRRRARWATGRSGFVTLMGAPAALLVLLASLPTPAVEIAAFDAATIAGAPAVVIASGADDTGTGVAATPVSPVHASVGDGAAAVESGSGEPGPAISPLSDERVDEVGVASRSPVERPVVSSAVWAGDSVAYDLAPAVIASLTAAGLAVDDLEAYPGFRLVTDRDNIDLRRLVVERVAEVGADLALVQISNWDTDVDSETYRIAVTDLAGELDLLGARLVLIATPPTASTDVNVELDRLFGVVVGLAGRDGPGNLSVVDSRPWWGAPGVLDLDADGSPERKRDLTHVCPSGAARFAALLADDLAMQFTGPVPGDPAVWADALWVFDERFDDPVGACAPVS